MKRWKRLCAAWALAMFTVLAALPLTGALAAGSQMTNLVVFVRFTGGAADAGYPGDAFNAGGNWAEIQKIYDGTGLSPDVSFKNYIHTISEGKLTVQNYFPQASGDTVSTYTLSEHADHYLSQSNDAALVDEVVQALSSGAILLENAPKLDYVNAGVVDNLTIIVQSRSSGDRSSPFYPHHAHYDGDRTVAGKRVFHYNLLDSDSLVDGNGDRYHVASKQGVVSHEFLHTLGLPDLYRTSGSGIPVGLWDIMASSSPYQQYPLAYLRSQLGWATVRELDKSGTYTLRAVDTASGDRAFCIKTPLSDHEFFMLEYRHKNETAPASVGFETKIPSSGLLMYRVNTAVPYHTNIEGENYLYVFRPNATSIDGADEKVDGLTATYKAALGGSGNATSYGSTDLDAPYTDNTLFFSNGKNSGIKIDNVVLSADGEEVTFDLTMPDYTGLALWAPYGSGNVADNANASVSLATGETGEVFVAYETMDSGRVSVKKSTGGAWTAVGDVPGLRQPKLAAYGGALYLCGIDTGSNKAVGYRLENGGFAKLWSGRAAPSGMQLMQDDAGLYCAYASENQTLVICNAADGAVITDTLSAGYLSNPAVCTQDGAFYALYSDFNAKDETNQAMIWRFDPSDHAWNKIRQTNIADSNVHALAAGNGVLYAFAQVQNANVLLTWDGTQWQEETLSGFDHASDVSIHLGEKSILVSYLDLQSSKVKVMEREQGAWTQFGEDVADNVNCFTAAGDAANLYVCTVDTGSGTARVRYRAYQAAVPPTSPAATTVTLTPPAGYEDATVYFDGRQTAATSSGDGAYTAAPPNKQTNTAVMYRYNAQNVPVGMYVWRIGYTDAAGYSATPAPELEDLLSYHGFSIRITGASGIRFKTGIATQTRQALLGPGGLNGYVLQEYGTLMMTSANQQRYPFVKGGEKVRGGRAYWSENGQVNDMIFETVSGRHRFTSVLVGLPVSEYKTEFAFRGYALIQKDGQTLTLYGPPVKRSIYAIAKQIVDQNQYAPGSSADQFVRKLISDADAS